MPRSRTCGRSPTSGHERDVDRHCDPRATPRPQSYPRLGPRQDPRRSSRGARHRRDRRRRTGSRRASCSTPTTSTPPSRNSMPGTLPAKRPPTRTLGRSSRGAYAAFNRHELRRRRRTWSISTTGAVQRSRRRDDRIHPGGVGPHARLSVYIETVHRLSDLGAVFTQGAWDLARGLRRRVAGDRHLDCRRRLDQPLRDLRRGRPRRRAREVR